MTKRLVQPADKINNSLSQSFTTPLSQLPLEIIHTIIEELDLVSISNLCLASKAVRILVKSHNAYVLLTTNETTRSTLKILFQTKLIYNHNLATLTSSLQAKTCSCCQRDQAQYLSLPLGIRACFTCLHDCPQFQLIPVSLAASTFGLTDATFASITLHTVPGMYRTHQAVYKCAWFAPLVNVMQAREVAVRIRGAEDLDRYMASRKVDLVTYVAPVAARARFVTPYTNMRLNTCSVRNGTEELMRAQDIAALGTDRLGLTVMGCELWPKMVRTNEWRLDHPPVEGWRMRNDYRKYKNQKAPAS